MGSIHEKNQGPKILCYCTFNAFTTVAKVDKRYDNLTQKYLAYKYGPNTGEIQM